MQVQIIEGVASLRDGVPTHYNPGDVADFPEVEAQQLIAAGVAVPVEEPEAPKRKVKVV